MFYNVAPLLKHSHFASLNDNKKKHPFSLSMVIFANFCLFFPLLFSFCQTKYRFSEPNRIFSVFFAENLHSALRSPGTSNLNWRARWMGKFHCSVDDTQWLRVIHSVSINTVGKCAAYACIGEAFLRCCFLLLTGWQAKIRTTRKRWPRANTMFCMIGNAGEHKCAQSHSLALENRVARLGEIFQWVERKRYASGVVQSSRTTNCLLHVHTVSKVWYKSKLLLTAIFHFHWKMTPGALSPGILHEKVHCFVDGGIAIHFVFHLRIALSAHTFESLVRILSMKLWLSIFCCYIFSVVFSAKLERTKIFTRFYISPFIFIRYMKICVRCSCDTNISPFKMAFCRIDSICWQLYTSIGGWWRRDLRASSLG